MPDSLCFRCYAEPFHAMAYRNLSPADADAQVRHGKLTLVDVRPPEEREIASVAVEYAALEGGGLERLLALPKDTPLAFLCHHGSRSAQAASYFAQQGFDDVYNVVGGIDAWSSTVDPAVPRY
jgi:monothiol glutaredoxin